MTKDSVSWYLNHAGREPLLTTEEEVILGRAIQEWQTMEPTDSPTTEQRRIIRRGQRAKERFFKANLRLVINVAKKYTRTATHLELSDLIQEGNIGLNRAIEKFDPSRGYKFSTYAYWWIRQGITRALTQCERTVKLPVNAVEVIAKLRPFLQNYQAEHGRMPSIQACMDHVGMKDAATMRLYLQNMQSVVSLDSCIAGDPDNSTYLDALACDGASPWDHTENAEYFEHLAKLKDHVHTLPKPQQEVIQLRFNLNGDTPEDQEVFFLRPYISVAKALGMSRQAVQQREARAIKMLHLALLGECQKCVA